MKNSMQDKINHENVNHPLLAYFFLTLYYVTKMCEYEVLSIKQDAAYFPIFCIYRPN